MKKILVCAVPAAIAVAALACNDAAGPPAAVHLETIQAAPAAAAPGLQLRDTLTVRLVDAQGHPRAGQSVSWSVLAGGGSLTALSSTTDQAGLARAVWRLGDLPGTNQAEALTQDDSAAVFQTEGRALKVDQFDSNYGLGCGLVGGDVWCWGQTSWLTPAAPVSDNPDLPFYTGPFLAGQGTGFTTIAVGDRVVCGIDAGYAVQCLSDSTLPLNLPSLPPMRTIVGENWNTFCGATATDSTAWCWDVRFATSAQIPSSPAFVDLAFESNLSNGINGCGRLADSTAMCWGEEMLGDGTFGTSASPVAVSGGHKFAEIGVGVNYACGRQANGDVWCWGRDDQGQLGGPGADSPVPVLAASGVSQLAVGRQTVLAVQGGGLIRWGRFGNGTNNPPTALTGVPGLPIGSLGRSDFSCFRYADGEVYCFEELWTNSSTLDWDLYVPVMPVP